LGRAPKKSAAQGARGGGRRKRETQVIVPQPLPSEPFDARLLTPKRQTRSKGLFWGAPQKSRKSPARLSRGLLHSPLASVFTSQWERGRGVRGCPSHALTPTSDLRPPTSDHCPRPPPSALKFFPATAQKTGSCYSRSMTSVVNCSWERVPGHLVISNSPGRPASSAVPSLALCRLSVP
jgi:hypothetical protein